MGTKFVKVRAWPKAGNKELAVEVSPATVTPKADQNQHPKQPDKWDKVRWKVEPKVGWKARLKKLRVTVEPGADYQYEGFQNGNQGVEVRTGTMKGDVTDGQQCKYDVVVTGELDGNEISGHLDPDIVIDLETPAGGAVAHAHEPIDEQWRVAGLLAKEHRVEIRVVEDDTELGFRAALVDASQGSVRVMRALGDTVAWCLAADTPRGFRFYCRPKPDHAWPMSKRRYNPRGDSFPAGVARLEDDLPEGCYSYDIVVVRMLPPGGEYVIDPDIVIDDEPAWT